MTIYIYPCHILKVTRIFVYQFRPNPREIRELDAVFEARWVKLYHFQHFQQGLCCLLLCKSIVKKK